MLVVSHRAEGWRGSIVPERQRQLQPAHYIRWEKQPVHSRNPTLKNFSLQKAWMDKNSLISPPLSKMLCLSSVRKVFAFPNVPDGEQVVHSIVTETTLLRPPGHSSKRCCCTTMQTKRHPPLAWQPPGPTRAVQPASDVLCFPNQHLTYCATELCRRGRVFCCAGSVYGSRMGPASGQHNRKGDMASGQHWAAKMSCVHTRVPTQPVAPVV